MELWKYSRIALQRLVLIITGRLLPVATGVAGLKWARRVSVAIQPWCKIAMEHWKSSPVPMPEICTMSGKILRAAVGAPGLLSAAIGRILEDIQTRASFQVCAEQQKQNNSD